MGSKSKAPAISKAPAAAKKPKNRKKLIIILSVIIVVIAGTAIGVTLYIQSLQRDLDRLAGTEISNVDLAKVPNGVYIGDFASFPVAAEVAVTVQNHVITSIELLRHTTGKGQAAEVIPSRVVETQSLKQDAVSGATYSSQVILKAIEVALESAIN